MDAIIQPEQALLDRIMALVMEVSAKGTEPDADGRLDYEEVSSRLEMAAAHLTIFPEDYDENESH